MKLLIGKETMLKVLLCNIPGLRQKESSNDVKMPTFTNVTNVIIIIITNSLFSTFSVVYFDDFYILEELRGIHANFADFC